MHKALKKQDGIQWDTANHRLSLANVFGLQTIVPFYSEDDCSKLRGDLSRVSSNGSSGMPPSLDATIIKLYRRPQHQYQHHGSKHEPIFISHIDTSRMLGCLSSLVSFPCYDSLIEKINCIGLGGEKGGVWRKWRSLYLLLSNDCSTCCSRDES